MIKTITIRNIASYDPQGVVIDDLNKVNFIYGSNGSGKTTISNLISEEAVPCFSDSQIYWQHDIKVKSLVYNKAFRENNFGKGTIEGVFTLGEATKEEIELIDEKKKKLEEIKKTGIQKKETLEKQEKNKKKKEDAFRESSWKQIYKHHERNFKEAFKGFMQKEKFRSKLLLEHKNNEQPLLELNVLIDKSETIFGEIPQRLASIPSMDFARLAPIEEDNIWNTKVIGKTDVDIATLIQLLNINDWVNQGRLLLQEDETCPFCQQPTITQSFRSQLERYFDETFTKSTAKIKRLSDEYKTITESLRYSLDQIEASEKINKNTKLDINRFLSEVKALLGQLSTNIERLSTKEKEPSRIVDIVSTNGLTNKITNTIRETNDIIQKHNSIVDNYQSERQVLINSIWKYVVESYREEIEEYESNITGLSKGIENLSQQYLGKRMEYKTLDAEIKQLSNNVTSIEPTIHKINATLNQFGFLNFEIVPSKEVKNHYQLQRENGELAEGSLSEGEITFITFLYFMQLAVGSTNRDDIADERILVVDDPISSLDSTVLFVVSTLLKGVINNIKKNEGNIKQLILLTHNVYFHKEASFVNGREEKNNSTNYWILRKADRHTTIQSFGNENPIKTSYELLWKELKHREYNSGVTIQNTMRRIIENYFKILGKYGDDDLIKKFKDKEDQEICRSLISWINDGSHSITDDLYIELQADAIDKYLKVFEDIFVLTNHEEHYKMMMI
ncbi:MAG: AAA family ATPase [Desulfobulbaceae bacterium]|nr:AAA family ATPase [Desulfobulbaceae bacterium]